eukprot:c10816_g1_i1.p1 GENE.c10816_g1_i1~~c10816_g1_i1.p1  ORF type:complete len:280 (+),score=60.53 c10816_g1_i1:63-902(+)
MAFQSPPRVPISTLATQAGPTTSRSKELPLCPGTEQHNSAWYGASVITGNKKTECQDRLVVCGDLEATSKSTVETVRQFLGEIPGRTALFAVFDGHAGNECSAHLAVSSVRQFWQSAAKACEKGQQRTVDAFLETTLTDMCDGLEKSFLAKFNKAGRRDGSCGNICVVWGKKIACANVGDSRALVLDGSTVLALSEDHKPDRPDERQRIERSGSHIEQDRKSLEFRIAQGNIAVSRAFGNSPFKGGSSRALIATPDIVIIDITPTMNFLLLASDGIWCR